jgi:phosphohistidine phosphatase SixA
MRFSLKEKAVVPGWLIALTVVLLTAFAPQTGAGEGEDQLWRSLRAGGEHFALLRHALAPGSGDPDGFIFGDCTTQRNLSAAGRRQAERIGQRFRQQGIFTLPLYTSQWCRCTETARLLDLGEPTILPALNSFFRENDQQEERTSQLRQWLLEQDLSRPILLVTHQVNITAFSGVFPGSGELVIVQRTADGGFLVLGTVQVE